METEYVRTAAFRGGWQLHELVTGELVRCPPKGDSYPDLDSTDWLSALVFNRIARTKPTPLP